jgi:TolB-like protein/Tfp pilus assembly protein PilF
LSGLVAAGVIGRMQERETPASAASTAGTNVIVVRPFHNLTGDPAQEYFAAGLRDVLLAHLGSIRALHVIPLEVNIEDVRSRHPNVTHILEASVLRANGRLRISVRLANAATGTITWGRPYDGSDTEVFALQGLIAAELARDLNIHVTDAESRHLSRTYHVSADAQEAYLRGRYLLDTLARDNLVAARVELERAVQLEPRYAPAHASLAFTYLALGNVGELSPQQVRTLAPDAAHKAFELDPSLADAALALADVRFRLEWDWDGAEAAYRSAVELNPSHLEARTQFARFLAAAEKPVEALREAEAALRMDALSPEAHNVFGVMLYYNRRYADAITHYLTRPNSPTARGHIGLGRAYAAAGRYSEALSELAAAYELSDNDASMLAEYGRTAAEAGDVTRARNVLAELLGRRASGSEYIAPQDLAYIHVALGEPDEAFALLNQAIDEQASRLLWLGIDPRVDALRTDPRFTPLLARIGRR